ncbi:IS200/IS605 family transposase [Sulfuriroseicoccus oceanibius]|uniref:IS200/IS605 family transposase n=1 Tax=Sulfuriroseicoccus oceanibius TaxID=2707525 RepID=A0A6B3L5A9_9BACT|nr:IS200/IS605 family transposase [Sulfuriroseicoccus oceanibius]QQL44774.1 IS200/IS605 family transposase [Sulfuriroseicoccus oceanibius]
MASTHVQILYHCVWSTKYRDPVIRAEVENDVWSVIVGVGRHNEIEVLKVGGVDDHVHVLVRVPKTMAVAEAVKRLKAGSSKSLNENRVVSSCRFAWQAGYGAFTVSSSAMGAVKLYIETQREHHRASTFQEEYVKLLKLHGVEYDEAYLWT